jgi:hypothetical protein
VRRWVSLRCTHATIFEYDFAFSRRDTPGVLLENLALEIRAQGRPGARCTRGLACDLHQKVCTRAYRSAENTPAFPAQWLYGLYVIVLVTGFLATIIGKKR